MLPVEDIEHNGSSLAMVSSGASIRMPASRNLSRDTAARPCAWGFWCLGTWLYVVPRQTLTTSSEYETVPLPPSHQSTSWGALSSHRYSIQAKDVVTRRAVGCPLCPSQPLGDEEQGREQEPHSGPLHPLSIMVLNSIWGTFSW